MTNNSLTVRTAEVLSDMISKKNIFKAGEKLPSQIELGKILGVSRVTVREAIRMLEAKNLVEVRRGDGTYVNSNPLYLSSMFDGFNELTSTTVSKELFELRLIIEPQAAYYAALRAEPKEIEDMRKYMLEIEERVEKGESRLVPESMFHSTIAKASHNIYIMELSNILNKSLEEVVLNLDKTTQVIAFSIVDHRQIFEMIEAKVPDGAYSVMRTHICHAFMSAGYSID